MSDLNADDNEHLNLSSLHSSTILVENEKKIYLSVRNWHSSDSSTTENESVALSAVQYVRDSDRAALLSAHTHCYLQLLWPARP